MSSKAARILLFSLFGLPPFAAWAEEDLRALVKELTAQVKQLSSRVNELEQKLAKQQDGGQEVPEPTAAPGTPDQAQTVFAAPKPLTGAAPAAQPEPAKHEAKPVTAGDVKGSYKIPGTDTSIAVGGYAKLDAVYNSVSAGADKTADQFLIPGAIPVGSGTRGEHSQVTFTARESRLWLKSFTPTAWGDLNAYLEIDFYGDDTIDERTTNSHAPRLRHAYGTFGNLLGGQTWSTFMNVAALPELTDLGGPVGQIFIRQPLLRWTRALPLESIPLELQVALESPETTLTLLNGDRLTPDDDRSPDLVARLNYSPDWGSLSIAGLGRQIRYSNNQQSADSRGGAVSLAGRVRTTGLDNFRFMFNYGNVLGRYVSYNLFNDGVLNASGQIDLLNILGGFVAYQHWWSPSWRSTVAYGLALADYPGFVAPSVSRRASSLHVNLLWSPLLQTTIGLEYIYAQRELESGEDGDLQRVQFSTRFDF